MNFQAKQPPLIAHVIYYLGVGGLENGLINLFNNMPKDTYRHVVICLTEYTNFRHRLKRDDIEFIALHKKAGNDPGVYVRLWKTFRALKPDIVHTRNLAALETQFVAALARIPCRVHGEHGRDVFDLHGRSRKYNLLRKAMRYLVQHYVTVSKDLEDWLITTVGVPSGKITQIYNGVNSDRFSPRKGERPAIGPQGFVSDSSIVIGTVGRMAEVKDQVTLAKAFIQLTRMLPHMSDRLRLVMIGDGPLRETVTTLMQDAGLDRQVWLPGDRDDVPEMLRAMDIFVLPSLGEGISNTILEAMSTGLPVVATAVGGNGELVVDGLTGRLVAAAQPQQMASAIQAYMEYPDDIHRHGQAGRERVETLFSISRMVKAYEDVYDAVLQAHG